MISGAIVSNLDNATGGGGSSDNSDTFAGYLTYGGTNNPSPEVHVSSSPNHHVLTTSTTLPSQVRHLYNIFNKKTLIINYLILNEHLQESYYDH